MAFLSCDKNDDYDRKELAGTPTSIVGNVKDYHRNTSVDDFEIALVKIWSCPEGGIGPNYCIREVGKVLTDSDGNFDLEFEYNLRADETYRLLFNEDRGDYRYVEYLNANGEFTTDYEALNIIKGQENSLTLNAFKPVKVSFNLTVLNNHTPPLVTGIKYNGNFEFGTNFTYASEPFEKFELMARPNSQVEVHFWYIENYTSNNPTSHFAPSLQYTTSATDDNEITIEIDCNDF
jgi:hypothetical protein